MTCIRDEAALTRVHTSFSRIQAKHLEFGVVEIVAQGNLVACRDFATEDQPASFQG